MQKKDGVRVVMKKLFCAVLVAVMLCCVPSYAAAEGNIYTEYKVFKASVYVCDTENGLIILRNVKAQKLSDGDTARALEYTAVPINPNGMFEQNGSKLTAEVVNGYLLDREATVFVGKSRGGYRVVYLNI